MNTNLHEQDYAQYENLDVRIKLFTKWLEEQPCTNLVKADNGKEYSACEMSSQIGRMCSHCQTKMIFYHTVLNWDAYHPNPNPGFVGLFTE